MKAFVKLLTICLLVSFIAGCAVPAPPPPAETEPTEATESTAQEPALTEAEAWLKAAELGEFAPAEQDWAAIEAAAKEEGKVLV